MNKEFAVHKVNEAGMAKAQAIAAAFDELLNKVGPLMTGDPRCAALVRTKLEEACFFCKKSMASDAENLQAEPPKASPPFDGFHRL